MSRHHRAFAFGPARPGIFNDFGDQHVRLAAAPLAAIFLQLGGVDACAEPVSLSVFAGAMTDNRWQDLAFTPWDVDYLSSFLFGAGINIAMSDPYVTRIGVVYFSFEPQLTGHTGVQDLIQLDLPYAIRFAPKTPVLGIDRFAFGIGPSYSNKSPDVEEARGLGEAENTMIYWKIEIERALRSRPRTSVFARLHHRSSGFGLMGNSGSSNAVVFGFRQDF